MDGAAFDIAMTNHDPHAFEEAMRAVGFLGFGFYREPRNNFMHVDLGPKRTWSSRWRTLTPGFTPEPPAQKPLTKSRTMKGSGVAGLASVGDAGVEVIQDAAAETQVALQPLIPDLGTMRWLSIAAALDNLRRLPPKDPIATTGWVPPTTSPSVDSTERRSTDAKKPEQPPAGLGPAGAKTGAIRNSKQPAAMAVR